ncbi:MAG: glutamate--tRNA ligase [Candidatus Melainabacteria bacterium]|mgnify:CR=1 FL=1|nr:glutamate--tRNA ligase [Candidatus Melainabacteria bacterium]
MIKTRIAPSPTGNLHLGTVRTALYNQLLAKSLAGKFCFRLEDTDRTRSNEDFTKEIIEGFKWLNIDWDGDMVRQSERGSHYQEYVDQLIANSKAYKCYANAEELEEMRKAQRAKKLPEGYDNRGRKLSTEQIKQYESDERKFVIRLNLGIDRNIEWNDVVRGPMSINTKDIGGDPIIQKFDGQVLYNFAVVVDDHAMEMTHVFRGEDHLTNTAKQIAIYQALDFQQPIFGHLPLIFTKDKQKLSKRKHGDIAGVDKYRKEGYLPEALVNYLIATSYSAIDDTEIYSLDESAKTFDPHRISKSPAIYDIAKLNWFNREYISKFSHDELMAHLKPYLKYDLSVFTETQQTDLIDAIRGNLNKFDEINNNVSYFFDDEEIEEKQIKFVDEGKPVLNKLLDVLSADGFDFSNASQIKEEINKIGEELGLKAKQLFWPIRLALSSRSHGPDLGFVISLLGKDKSLARLSKHV